MAPPTSQPHTCVEPPKCRFFWGGTIYLLTYIHIYIYVYMCVLGIPHDIHEQPDSNGTEWRRGFFSLVDGSC